MDDAESSESELLPHEEDYPAEYTNMAHPDDYVPVIAPSRIVYYPLAYEKPNMRLICRVWMKCSDETFVPLSFVVDTGAPPGMYLSKKARKCLYAASRLKTDDKGDMYIRLQDGKVLSVHETPRHHEPGNILGMRAILHLGLDVNSQGFQFKVNDNYYF